MAIILGLDVNLFRGTAGATAVTEVNNIKDLTLNEATERFISNKKRKTVFTADDMFRWSDL